MRNLVLLKTARLVVQPPEVDDNPADDAAHALAAQQQAVPASAVTFDQASRRAYLLFPDGRLHAVDLTSGTTLWHVQLPAGQWQWVQYVMESDSVFCASGDGQMVVVSVDTLTVEQIGNIDQVLSEAQVSVQQSPHPVLALWRNDAEFLVTSCISADSGQRVVQVWAHDLTLHAQGRHEDGSPVPDLGAVLAWSVDQSLIASVQTVRDETHIVFFERNGLRHGQFTLEGVKPGHALVTDLRWNLESDVLAVVVAPSPAAPPSIIQFWHRSNYTWMLKSAIDVTAAGFTVGWFQWNSEKPYHAAFCANPGAGTSGAPAEIWEVEMCWDYHVSSTPDCTAAVIDGLPPPLCFVKFVAAAAGGIVTATAFGPQMPVAEKESVRHLVAALSTSGLTLSEVGLPTPASQADLGVPSLIATAAVTVPTEANVQWAVCRQLAWVEVPAGDEFEWLFCVEAGTDGDSLLRFQVTRGGPTTATAAVTRCAMYARVLRIMSHPSKPFLIAELDDGCVLSLSCTAAELYPVPLVSLPEACTHIGIVPALQSSADVVLGLAGTRLFANHALLSPACGSFRIHTQFQFALHTTLGPSPALSFSSFTALHNLCNSGTTGAHPQAITGSATPAATTENDQWATYSAKLTRAIERGARLVAVMPGNVSVVLQMPRGNLEIIAPRALVLAATRELLDAGQYGAALALVREHRVDMNILYDHNPAAFAANAMEFVRQVAAGDRLDVFLASLVDEDVTVTKYPPPPGYVVPSTPNSGQPAVVGDGKVNFVCGLVRQSALEHDPQELFLTVLTSFAQMKPPDMESALSHIRTVTHSAGINSGRAAEEAAISHLALLVDGDQLFKTALGMYDLALAGLVAHCSQKDPKEYAPFLAALHAQPELRKRIEIDTFLKRYALVVDHYAGMFGDAAEAAAVKPEDEDACLAVVQEHKLFLHALQLLTKDRVPHMYNRLMDAYGKHLTTELRHEEALLAFSEAGSAESALRAAVGCSDWRIAMVLAARLEYTPDQCKLLALEMVSSLKRVGRDGCEGAATLLLTYVNDPVQAVEILASGGSFDEACRVACAYGQAELVDTVVHPAVIAAAGKFLEENEKRQEAFTKALSKLRGCREYRRRLLEREAALAEEEAAGDYDGDGDAASVWTDAQSVAQSVGSFASAMSGASGASGMSTLSTASSRTDGAYSHISRLQSSTDLFSQGGNTAHRVMRRQKKNRGRRAGKEGFSQGTEEEDAHWLKAVDAQRITDDVRATGRALCRTLMLMGDVSLAKEIQTKLEAISKMMEDTELPENVPFVTIPGRTPQKPPKAVPPAWKWDLLSVM